MTVRALNGQGMLTEYRELFVPRKEMQEELASIIFAPKLIVTNNRKVIEEYRRRHPEEFKEKEDNNGKEI